MLLLTGIAFQFAESLLLGLLTGRIERTVVDRYQASNGSVSGFDNLLGGRQPGALLAQRPRGVTGFLSYWPPLPEAGAGAGAVAGAGAGAGAAAGAEGAGMAGAPLVPLVSLSVCGSRNDSTFALLISSSV